MLNMLMIMFIGIQIVIIILLCRANFMRFLYKFNKGQQFIFYENVKGVMKVIYYKTFENFEL